MKSKIAIAKLEQGYIEKPLSVCCGACKHYQSKMTVRLATFSSWTDETERRCGMGGFKVKKTARCDRFEARRAEVG